MKDDLEKTEDETYAEAPTDSGGAAGGEEFGDTGYEGGSESSPQRSGLMVLLLIVALGGGGIYLMHMRAGPSSAMASPEIKDSQEFVQTFIADGPKNIGEMQDMLRNTEKVVQQFINYPQMTQVGLDQLKTNPFMIPRSQVPIVVHKGPDLGALALEREKAEVKKAFDALQLQSILYADSGGTCLINSRAYNQGQVVNGFTIEKIDRSAVVVRKPSAIPGQPPHIFNLPMPQPR